MITSVLFKGNLDRIRLIGPAESNAKTHAPAWVFAFDRTGKRRNGLEYFARAAGARELLFHFRLILTLIGDEF